MTREELIALVKPLKWSRTSFHSFSLNKLRCKNGDCPITAAYRLKFGIGIPVWSWKKAADQLGMPRNVAAQIVSEADFETVPELESVNE